MHYYLYKITNLINGKIYIGKHQTEDLEDGYIGSGVVLRKDFKKFGIENFSKEIIEFHECDRELCLAERKVVNEDFVKREDTYNCTTGGNGSWSHTKNMVTVKDKNGNMFKVKTDDPRYLSGELVHIATGNVTVKDKNGNTFSVDKNDPRYLFGELTGHSFGTVVVKDKDGNMFRVKIDDPRFLNGELIKAAMWDGKKHKPETLNKIKNTMAKHKHQQGKKNSQFGKCWIHNLEQKKSIRIKKEEIEKFLSEGWIKGRKMKF